ncbi:MAG: NAD(P)H-dependent oxidoreductase subunit E [Akkermansiaceae bacterium]|nr:NAD(P)H-dependent oxidoreductase subunit E [Akkermansiaceae bacterium]MCF7730473.1 NAD(P)H-dependent oxidoreductase subunit E [Akkermansiaceae bacterium]
MNEVITILEHQGTGRDACVKVLQEIQGVFGYLPAEALRYVADHSQITKRQIYGVATFYELFRFKPPGRHQVKVCRGTACHVRGAPQILDAVAEELNLHGSEDTTEDGEFTFEKIACFGACALAPVTVTDGQTHGAMTPDKMRKQLKAILKKARAGKQEDPS